MYKLATEEFSMVGTYFYTNVAFKYPFPQERQYNPFYAEPQQEALIEEDDEDDDDVDENISELEAQPEDVPVPFLPEATQIALINKLRERAYEGRRKKQEAALLGLREMWAKTWVRMSSQSQSKVREESGLDRACLELGSIKLWTYILKSHLTHIFGEDDEMSVANIHDKVARYINCNF